ncbi:MAG: tRNA pseudouridine(13) synthase TruD, partial [Candidatus Bathyarchaeia archaeon]
MKNLEVRWNTLPYITSGLEGIGGKIRAVPSHFIVEELPRYEPIGRGEHLYINLTKKGLTTRDVQKLFATFLGLNERDIGFAGLKDKNAITTQT